ncbi:MAG: hypothetical protein BM564_09500 [Bacteroidetes bacterium MedPE-SWsnd-G2]|nr:MAG: hypothetical protein BM564_09500 [Bacteroidetes bacterium MedPE-SWsnd-G2]
MRNFTSPLEAFQYWEQQDPDAYLFKQPFNGVLKTYTYKQAGHEVRQIAAKLKSFDLAPGSHVALLSKNCAHWVMSDLAIMLAGYVSIPIYPTLNEKSINQILTHSEARAIIVGKLDDYNSQKSGIPSMPIISVDAYGLKDGYVWEDIIEGNESVELPKFDLEQLHTIIYTSGTTGKPKGVMHSLGNFMYSSSKLISLLDLPNQPRLFSYLPLAHVAERLIMTNGLILGAEISYPESLETFAKNLEDCQPNMFFGVPRIWTKFQEKILEKLPQGKLDFLLKLPIISSIIKTKLKKKLGLMSSRFNCSAAAPISPSLIKWYNTIGVDIYQGYGMTEDCCVSHFNLKGQNKVGTVGKTIDEVEVRLSDEGEICIKNKSLMLGYFKSPVLTSAAFDSQGYLKTGDIGEFDEDGYLTITGRIKDQFKTDKGKYISPAPIEVEFEKNTDIEQICIVGTGLPHPIALITLSELARQKSNDELELSLLQTLETINPKFERHEHVARIIVMKDDWNVENGLTTPTLKVKRSEIEKLYSKYYSEWYNSDNQVLFE